MQKLVNNSLKGMEKEQLLKRSNQRRVLTIEYVVAAAGDGLNTCGIIQAVQQLRLDLSMSISPNQNLLMGPPSYLECRWCLHSQLTYSQLVQAADASSWRLCKSSIHCTVTQLLLVNGEWLTGGQMSCTEAGGSLVHLESSFTSVVKSSMMYASDCSFSIDWKSLWMGLLCSRFCKRMFLGSLVTTWMSA